MPMDPKKRPKNWRSEIRPRILARDGRRCRCCGVIDQAYGYRDAGGKFHALEPGTAPPPGRKPLTILMNVVHLDHLLVDHADDNLGLMCQRCHGNYDKPITAVQAAYTNKYPGAAHTGRLEFLP